MIKVLIQVSAWRPKITLWRNHVQFSWAVALVATISSFSRGTGREGLHFIPGIVFNPCPHPAPRFALGHSWRLGSFSSTELSHGGAASPQRPLWSLSSKPAPALCWAQRLTLCFRSSPCSPFPPCTWCFRVLLASQCEGASPLTFSSAERGGSDVGSTSPSWAGYLLWRKCWEWRVFSWSLAFTKVHLLTYRAVLCVATLWLLWLFQRSWVVSRKLPQLHITSFWEQGGTSFCLGGDPWVSISPGCFPYTILNAGLCSPTFLLPFSKIFPRQIPAWPLVPLGQS